MTDLPVALIADDNDDNRNICRMILEKSGISVIEAVNGQQAIDVLEQQAFFLLLLDMQMPIVDGPGVMRWLGTHATNRPKNVIILTANPHWVTTELQDTADYIMHKPIATVEFTKFVRRLTGTGILT